MKILEIRSKSKEDAINQALDKLNVKLEDLKIEVLENPTKGFLGFLGAKDGLYKFTVIEKEIEKEVDIAKSFIENILKNSNIDANLSVTQEGNVIKVDIKGQDASALIGRRGETLDSIQLLTGLALNKINEDYRSKREESLIRYAHKVAREVSKTKKTKKLDYMNPYERRIIHSALQNNKYVSTYSEGTDPYRRLVIEYIK